MTTRNDMQDKPKQQRGFRCLPIAQVRAIAGKGGKAAHDKGRAHEWDHVEASIAGRLGGLASAAAKKRRRGERMSPTEPMVAAYLVRDALAEVRVALQRERDLNAELLAALKHLLRYHFGDSDGAMEARAAIAHAESRANISPPTEEGTA